MCRYTISQKPLKTKMLKKMFEKKIPQKHQQSEREMEQNFVDRWRKIVLFTFSWGLQFTKKADPQTQTQVMNKVEPGIKHPVTGGVVSWCVRPVFNNQDDQSFGYIKYLKGSSCFIPQRKCGGFNKTVSPKAPARAAAWFQTNSINDMEGPA